jgi:hypothetical protein
MLLALAVAIISDILGIRPFRHGLSAQLLLNVVRFHGDGNKWRGSAKSQTLGKEKSEQRPLMRSLLGCIFSSLAGGKTGIFSKIAHWVWGRNAPTSAGEQSGQMAFLYYRAKLASGKFARIQEGQN